MTDYPKGIQELFYIIGQQQFEKCYSWAERNTESPIEAQFLAALITSVDSNEPLALKQHDNTSLLRVSRNGKPFFEIDTQVSIEGYRVDFLICFPNGKSMAVECDGRDFHHANADQIARDRQRDQKLIASGIEEVMRIPGTQICNDTFGAVMYFFQRVIWHVDGRKVS